MSGSQNAIEVIAVGVGDEDLPEVLAAHVVDNARHPAGIEFVEDVVEQQ